MKRKEPEGGFAVDTMQSSMKRAKKMIEVENSVELRKKAKEDKENVSVKENCKSFMNFFTEKKKADDSGIKVEEVSKNSMIQEMSNKLLMKRKTASQLFS
jgi:hypothetical protein